MAKNRKNSAEVLVTLGPTRAYLDRVRYISNYSTGELGFEICRSLHRRGFKVTAVAGPLARPFAWPRGIKVIAVETHSEMLAAVMSVCRHRKLRAAIFTAAVLDFAPARTERGKVSSAGVWNVRLVPTPKIVDRVAKKFPEIVRIGFKLEWKRQSAAAEKKIVRSYLGAKGLSAIGVNYLSEISGRAHPMRIYRSTDEMVAVKSKRAAAEEIAKILRPHR